MSKISTLGNQVPFVCACGRVIPYEIYEELAQEYRRVVLELESLRAQLRLPLEEEPIYLGEFKG